MNKKIAVITGASSGIGMELARVFAADGYDLIVTARRVELLQTLADEMSKTHGTSVRIIAMDLALPDAAAALWREIESLAPQVDVLVNNAGFGDVGDFARAELHTIEQMVYLNIATLTALTRLALPQMLARKQGNILNVASLAGFQPGGPGMAVYYASKSYVLSFSHGLRGELRGSGVNVTTLCPGATTTGFMQAANGEGILLFNWTKPMSAAVVARVGYRAMQRGCAVVVPGLMNKFLAISPRFSPTAIALAINRRLLLKAD